MANQNGSTGETVKSPATKGPDKGWGLNPAPGVRFHWSARAIFDGTSVDTLWDRQGVEGEASPEERKALEEWLNHKAMPMLRAMARDYKLPRTSEDAEVEIAGDGYRLRCNPRRSCGYLYISAALDESATSPTPKPAPEKKAKSAAAKNRFMKRPTRGF